MPSDNIVKSFDGVEEARQWLIQLKTQSTEKV
jgi:hypothetical protein